MITDNEAEKDKKRTDQQRKAIELYCKRVAKALDDSGESVQTAFTAPVGITQENVKEHMFKVVMKALYPGIDSTTDLTINQVTIVYENMNRLTADRYGVSMEFPSYSAQLNESLTKGGK